MGQSHPWYHTARWRRRRATQLRRFPLCRYCEAAGRIVAANIADHVIPHRGNWKLFFEGELQSLCQSHHGSTKQSAEKRGALVRVGSDGHPIEEARIVSHGFSIPHGVQPSAIPVHIVCGPPGSGKTTYVHEHKRPGDVVIDYDDIVVSLGGVRYHHHELPYLRKQAFVKRDALICVLSERTSGAAWLVLMAPTIQERLAWKRVLGDMATVHLLSVPKDECKRRISKDRDRSGRILYYHHVIDHYFNVRS